MLLPPSWATRVFKLPPPPPALAPHVMPAKRYITTPSDITLADLAWMYYRNPREWTRIYNANPWLSIDNPVSAGTTIEIP